MIAESIVLAIFTCSFGGIILIFLKKIPVLNTLPQNGTAGIKKHKIILNAENKVKDVLIYFEKQIFLHKFLSWVKCMTLKVEVKIDHLLHNIRKKAQEVDKEFKEKK